MNLQQIKSLFSVNLLYANPQATQRQREKGKTKCEQNMNKTRQPSMYKMVVRKESAIFFYPDRNFLHIQPYRQDWKLSHNLQHHIP